MKKLLISILMFLCLTAPAKAIINGNDEIRLDKPAETEVVSGSYNIQWYMKDPNQNIIPYGIDMFSKTCAQNGGRFGTIAASDQTPASANGAYTVSWNTAGPIKDKTSVPDGYYCLRVCGTFHNGNNYYGLCDKHTVQVSNTGNKSPVITSVPPPLTINVGSTFSYDVKATDADGDAITFSLSLHPDFLVIDPASGKITSSGPINTVGTYPVTVDATDGKGGKGEQVFTLNVVSGQSQANDITITSPTAASVFALKDNQITWAFKQPGNVSSIILYYSTDGNDWKQVTSPDKSATSYNWDVTALTPGNYYVKISVKDSAGNSLEKVSDKFVIAASKGGETVPLITGFKPADESTVDNTLRPVIGAKYSPSQGATIVQDKVKLLLDDKEMAKCDKSDKEITCEPEADLAVGRHKVSISIEDSNQKQDSRDWFFEITAGSTTATPTPTPGGFLSNVPIDTVKLAAVILCVGLLLLLVPWSLFLLITRRNNNQADNTYVPPVYQPQPSGSYNYTPAPAAPAAEVTVQQYQQPEIIPDQQFEHSIGSQSLGGSDSITSNLDAFGYTPVVNPIAETQPEMPKAYQSDEIPDWLKGADSDKVVTPGGQDLIGSQQAADQSATPYGTLGLTPQDSSDNQY